MLDRSKIGLDSGERTIDVEGSQLKLFCQAIGETNPIFWDDPAAKAAGYPACPVPPTFPAALDACATGGKNLVLDVLGVDLGRLLHGEQAFEYHRPIYAGDRIRLLTRIADIYDKKGGALEFIVLETTMHNQRGDLCAALTMTVVLRN